MGGKAKAPPAPNYGPLAASQQMSAQYSMELGKEQLAWAREQYAMDSARLDKQEANWSTIMDKMMAQQDQQSQLARADRERYERTFQPLEDQLVSEAAGYTDLRNAERAEQAAGRASADVSNQVAAARAAAQDRMESYGIDPSQVRSSLDKGLVEEGAARAGAANITRDTTRRAEEATGRALRSEALNIGKGYPGQIAANYGQALQAGQGAAGVGGQAVQAGLATTASGANTMGTGMGWQGLGNQALAGWGNTLNMGYQNQLDRYKAQNSASSGWGSALGLIGGIGMKALMPRFGFQEGGEVPPPGPPGLPVPPEASPSGGRAIDDVPARLSPGEFVVPEDTVKWLGEKHFQKLIMKSREEKAQAQARPRQQAVPLEEPTVVSPGAMGPATPPGEPGMARRAVDIGAGAVNALGDRMRGGPPAGPPVAMGIRGSDGGIVPRQAIRLVA